MTSDPTAVKDAGLSNPAMAAIWRTDQAGARTVDVHVRRIRAKTTEAPIVTTVRSIGYRLAIDAEVDVVRR
jgi:DNA-binding response OmpR family regulator